MRPRWSVLFLAMLTVLPKWASAESAPDAAAKLVTTESRVDELPRGTDPDSVTFSPDARRVAYWVTRDGKSAVVVDAVQGELGDSIEPHSLYGFGGELLEYVGRPGIVFSPDSTRVAYGARRGGLWCVVVDGKEGPRYDGVSALSLVTRRQEGTERLVLSQQPELVFSPNSARFGYLARRGARWFAVVDGAESKGYDGIRGLAFSPDSRRVAWVAQRGGRELVVIDGVEGAEEEEIKTGMAYYTRITASVAGCNGQAGGIAFSADGARVAYAARRAGKWHVVVDGQAGPGWDDVLRGSLAFSPDGRRIAYAGARDQRWYAVVDGVAGAGYNAVGGLVFSPDSQRFAYWAARGWPWRVIVIADGAEGKECSLIDGLLAFSPDSKHLAYVARDIGADRDAVVVDGVVRWSTGFLGASSPTFSPDSRHLAYEHWRSRSKTRQVVIDGAEGKQYEMMYAFAFDGPSVLHFGARQGRTLFRVEVKVSGGQMP